MNTRNNENRFFKNDIKMRGTTTAAFRYANYPYLHHWPIFRKEQKTEGFPNKQTVSKDNLKAAICRAYKWKQILMACIWCGSVN